MTITCATIREVWKTQVFAHINGGANSYQSEVWPENRVRRSAGYYDKRVDFWTYLVSSRSVLNMCQGETTLFEVKITRLLENDNTGASQVEIVDGFTDTLYNLVKTNLGHTWGGNVDVWTPPEDVAMPIETKFGQVNCWRIDQIYKAEIEQVY